MRALVTGAGFYYATTLIVLLGAAFGADFVRDAWPHRTARSLTERMAYFDGVMYRDILENGYSHEAGSSNTGFFPVFPLAGRLISRVFASPADLALLVVAHASLLATFCVFAASLQRRFPTPEDGIRDYSLLAFGLLPTTIFLRMAYAEATLCCVMAVVLYGMARGWRPVVLALLVGLATATRPVGIALVAPLALYAWRGGAGARRDKPLSIQTAWLLRLAATAALVCVACWGLVAFIVFQQAQFDDAWAFVEAQDYRTRLGKESNSVEELWATATMEPIWAPYVASKPDFWMRYERHNNPLFSLQFANPIYFVGTVVLVIIGWRKKWLNDYEILLSAGLLLIPYVLKSYDNAMASFGRFSIVVLPAYIVIGHLLARLPGPVAAAILCVSTFFLCTYSALFAAGYRLL